MATIPKAILDLLTNSKTAKFAESLKHSDLPTGWADDPEIVDLAAKAWQEAGTESPFFKAWFGGSKAVDDAGKPQVFYHGSNNVFDAFDPSKIKENRFGKTFNFINDPDYAGQYGDNIYSVYLKQDSPLTLDDLARDISENEYLNIAKALNVKNPSAHKDGISLKRIIEPLKDSDAFIDIMNMLNRDGFSLPEEGIKTVIRPDQIKSVNNRGTFNPSDPNIVRTLAPLGVGTAAMAAALLGDGSEAEAAPRRKVLQQGLSLMGLLDEAPAKNVVDISKESPSIASVSSPSSASLPAPDKPKFKPELVDYHWSSMPGEKYSAREEGLVPAMVSDWDAARESELSNRMIVHKYYVRGEDGNVRVYGKNSAMKALGLENKPSMFEKQAKKIKREAAEREARTNNILEQLEGYRVKSSKDEIRDYIEPTIHRYNDLDPRDRAPGLPASLGFSDYTVFKKGDQYTSWNDPEQAVIDAMLKKGWSIEPKDWWKDTDWYRKMHSSMAPVGAGTAALAASLLAGGDEAKAAAINAALADPASREKAAAAGLPYDPPVEESAWSPADLLVAPVGAVGIPAKLLAMALDAPVTLGLDAGLSALGGLFGGGDRKKPGGW